MPTEAEYQDEELRPLTQQEPVQGGEPRRSTESLSSISTTSLVLEQFRDAAVDGSDTLPGGSPGGHDSAHHLPKGDVDLEDAPLAGPAGSTATNPKTRRRRLRPWLWALCGVFLLAWLLALAVFLLRQTGIIHSPSGFRSGTGKSLTLDQVMNGEWRPQRHEISWIAGAHGEDGLLLERGGEHDQAYLVVKDVRDRSSPDKLKRRDRRTLMEKAWFTVDSQTIYPSDVWPSRDLNRVLVVSEKKPIWRHSYQGKYWLFDVPAQTGQALDQAQPESIIQLASWSPQSDAVAFVRDNNIFLRRLSSPDVVQITKDGGPELFHGIPDWVYEEEVFASNRAMWWAEDGRYIAFLRTNETMVPEYPIQYFVSRPRGTKPPPGLENYPVVQDIKYPKSGAPNPVVDLQFYDVERGEVFSVDVEGDFPDADRLITEVVWAGASGKVLVRETNRESDILRIVLIDVKSRTGRAVRTVDVDALDHGWFEVSQDTRYVPADATKGRPEDGYIDTVIHEGFDHLAYFTPMDNPKPVVLTSGSWEVVSAPSAVDLANNIVYFVATKESPIQRQVYSVKLLDGSDLRSVTEAGKEGYYDVSFSHGAGYALVSYNGPEVPWQELISTPTNPDHYLEVVEENKRLKAMTSKYSLPDEIYQTVTIDGFVLQVVERRPPHFNPKKKYPVLFHLYGGPGSQTVNKKFTVDFQAYVASNLEYIVVTVDGRGTGFMGRQARCIVRGNIGHYEALDQIETAKIWARKEYVDPDRLAIWGWSYGGFLTLKTLEMDAGRTFKYGMAVAPVTDWKFYDSIYTERYMHTPQHNPTGYQNSSISDMSALQSNVRFLIMHGVADDNVHMQNSLTLLDQLDLAAVENYDVHVFPDSDHSIFFHNANRMVYDRLNNWLINAFNGEWLRTAHPHPLLN